MPELGSYFYMLKWLQDEQQHQCFESHLQVPIATIASEKGTQYLQEVPSGTEECSQVKGQGETADSEKWSESHNKVEGRLMQDNLAEIAQKYPPNNFQRVFWEQHAKSSACKGG